MARKFRTKEWAVMMFIANDNNLGAFTDGKIAEIEGIGSTKAADVIIQFDKPGINVVRRMRLSGRRRFPLRNAQKETNTGDKRTLIRFIDFTCQDFPARRRMLVISNHGSGMTIAGDQRPPVFWAVMKHMKRRERFEQPPEVGTTDALDNIELKAALTVVARKHRRLDVLVFDACLMSTIEVAYQLRQTARFMVGSQSNIPIPGCLFTPLLKVLTNEKVSSAAVAEAFVEECIPQLVHDEYAAMAACDLELADEVAEAVSELAESLLAALEGEDHEKVFTAITLAHLGALAFLDSEAIDLFDFSRRLAETVEDAEVREAAANVQRAVDQFVLRANPQGAIVDGARGISITLPRRNLISEAYRQLDFARETSWVEFLEVYLKRRFPEIAEEPPGILAQQPANMEEPAAV